MLSFTRFEPTTHTEPIAIGVETIDLWAFEIGEPEPIVEAWKPLLSEDEARRAERFVFARDRNRWIVARGVLRHLLARYCGTDPAALEFEYASAGKPSIAKARTGSARLTFNLAHSHDRALVGVALNREIGVDLEHARDDFDPLPIAQQFFFGAELAAIEAAAPDSRREAFFRHWVAKEAVLKANGAGLSLALDSFGVAFTPDGSTARVHSVARAVLDQALVVRMLALAPGWHAAVAASGESWTLRFAS